MIFDSLITRIKERFDLVNKNRPRGITFYKLSKTLQILLKKKWTMNLFILLKSVVNHLIF